MLGCGKEWQHRSHMGSTPYGGGQGGQAQAWVPWGGDTGLRVKDIGPSSMMPPGVLEREREKLQGLAPDHWATEPRSRGHEWVPLPWISASPGSLRALDVMKPTLPFYR